MQINRFLIRIDDTMKRSFYEIECANNNWSTYKLYLSIEEELKAEIQRERAMLQIEAEINGKEEVK